MTNNKYIKSILYIVVFGILNLFNKYLLIPYTQSDANSHMNPASVFATIYIVITVGMTFLIAKYILKKNYLIGILFLLLSISCLYWRAQLLTITCQKCAMGG
jgi:hypothetical protein